MPNDPETPIKQIVNCVLEIASDYHDQSMPKRNQRERRLRAAILLIFDELQLLAGRRYSVRELLDLLDAGIVFL